VSVIYGCSNNKKTSEANRVVNIKLNLKGETRSIHDLQLIKDVEVISLESDDVMGEINKVIRFRDRIYLLDLFKGRCVYIFTTQGEFVNKIARFGAGPEEYTQLFDIFINGEDSTLNLSTRIDRKIFKFDLDGKKLIDIQRTPKSFTSILKVKNGYIAYMGNYREDVNKPDNLWLLDNKYKPVRSCFNIDEKTTGFSVNGCALSRYGDAVCFIRDGDFNVYSVNEGKESIKYAFEVEGQRQIDKKSGGLVSNDIEGFRNFQETRNHLLFSYIYNGQYMLGVYHKNEATTNVATLEPYNGKYFISFGTIIGYDEHAIYTIVSASSMKRSWNGKDDYNDFWKEHSQQIRNLRARFKSIDEGGNPFLIIYSID
jgi:hypothetical protein